MAVSLCPDCGAPSLRHRACGNCGKYKGKVVVDLKAKAEKKAKKMKIKVAEANK